MLNFGKGIVLAGSLLFNQVSQADTTYSADTLENIKVTKIQTANSLDLGKTSRNLDSEYIKNISEARAKIIKKASINFESYRLGLSNGGSDFGFGRNNIVLETQFKLSGFNIKGEVGTGKDNNGKSGVFAGIKTIF
ncbi:MAG: hypothetical protein PHV23_00770 [Candidatus Gracilibacteria bacterium]|nr:hypothetical protein [Candidatus Gracilibacteria bacterium]